LALDIDGTLTRPGNEGVDLRALDVLSSWPEPVVVATVKTFLYPVALCHFAGIEEPVVAENGGVVLVDGRVGRTGDGDRAQAVLNAYETTGGPVAWGLDHTTNRWRETEVAPDLSSARDTRGKSAGTRPRLLRTDASESFLREVGADYLTLPGVEVRGPRCRFARGSRRRVLSRRDCR
jgi:hypothetical protein